MPACTTPELWPVWWVASSGSRSRTVSLRPLWRRSSSRERASPRMPPPMTARSVVEGADPFTWPARLVSRAMASGRVLVTGATGFIGHHLPELLSSRGFEVATVSRAGGVDLLEPGAPERVVAEVQPTHLLHLAWYAEPGKYWTSPENVRWVEASLALLRAFAAGGGRRAVLAGTCAEYDWAHGFCSEGVTPLAPWTLYGPSKHALREMAESFAGE